ncbi:anti-sigma factor [Ornithinimicrobium sp. Arc0846-15]|nr:anti-sigma factor [Ornithinimicrobium laminariae]
MKTPEEHVDGLLAAYAVDAVDDAERVQVESHLTECAACREELALYSESVTEFSVGLDVAPPQHLRAQILESVAQEAAVVSPLATRRRRRAQQWLWGVAAAGVLAVGSWGIADVLNGEQTSVTDDIIQADGTTKYSADFEQTTLTVYVSPTADQAVLEAPDMPALADGEVYQVWFVTPKGTVVSAGVMPEGEDQFVLDGDPSAATAVALTVEPDPGVEQPTTDPVAAIPFEA